MRSISKLFKLFQASDLYKNNLKKYKEIKTIFYHRRISGSKNRSKINYFLQHINFFSGVYIFLFYLPQKFERWINSKEYLTNSSIWETDDVYKTIVIMVVFAWLLNRFSFSPKQIFRSEIKKTLVILFYHMLITIISNILSLLKEIIVRIINVTTCLLFKLRLLIWLKV